MRMRKTTGNGTTQCLERTKLTEIKTRAQKPIVFLVSALTGIINGKKLIEIEPSIYGDIAATRAMDEKWRPLQRSGKIAESKNEKARLFVISCLHSM